jgi:hypothetical protein
MGGSENASSYSLVLKKKLNSTRIMLDCLCGEKRMRFVQHGIAQINERKKQTRYLAEAGLEQRVRHVALRHLERAEKVAALVGALDAHAHVAVQQAVLGKEASLGRVVAWCARMRAEMQTSNYSVRRNLHMILMQNAISLKFDPRNRKTFLCGGGTYMQDFCK